MMKHVLNGFIQFMKCARNERQFYNRRKNIYTNNINDKKWK